MKRLMEKTVLVGLVTAWRLATVPTRRSPLAVNATTDGVVRPPSAFSMTVGSPPSRTAMHELVVPRSMPMVLAMELGGSFSVVDEAICVAVWQILARLPRDPGHNSATACGGAPGYIVLVEQALAPRRVRTAAHAAP